MTNSVPNIIFILIDDLGWKDLSRYGSTFYETPELDRLGAEGIVFTDAYASSPVCSPTRAAILTGKYPARIGLTQYIDGHAVGPLCDVPYFSHLPLSEVSLATTLKRNGFQTWHVGKWHLGNEITSPEKHGFDTNIGGSHFGHPLNGYFSPYGIPRLQDGPPNEYLTDRLTREAIGLIRQRDPQRPFFLNLWHYGVHTPIQAPEAVIEKYRRKAAALGIDKIPPFEFGETMPFVNGEQQQVCRRIIQSDPAYAAMVENLDQNTGLLLAVLEEEGLAENTLVVFTSDNGGLATAEGSPTCNAPLSEGKGWMYEGGTRVPLLMRWPGNIGSGMRCETPVTSTDLYPTVLEAARLGAFPEQHCDGCSLMPLLTGSGPLQRDAIFWHYPHYSNQGGRPACSIRSGDWKLIQFFEDNHCELYNLANDLSETCNRAGELPELTAKLVGRLEEWMAAVKASVPVKNPNFCLR